MDGKKYTRACLAALISLLACTALFNRVIDPFWYYRDITLQGINAVKTQFTHYERHVKPVILRETRPDAVIFSSSVLEAGLNPASPAFTRHGQYHGYNFGMQAAWWDHVYCDMQYALSNTTLKRVIIGIVAEPLPAIDCTSRLREMGSIQPSQLLLSWDALKASLRTLTQQDQPPTHTLDGMLFHHRYQRDKIEESFTLEFYKNRVRTREKACLTPGSLDIPTWTPPQRKEDTSGLGQLLDQLRTRGVEVKLVIYPMHALWMERLLCNDLYGRWHAALGIAERVQQANLAGGNVELWDFQGYSTPLTERIKNNQTRLWQDFGHFNYELGDAMLDLMYGRTQPTEPWGDDILGVRLTPETLPERFTTYFEARRHFIRQNPWFTADFETFSRGTLGPAR